MPEPKAEPPTPQAQPETPKEPEPMVPEPEAPAPDKRMEPMLEFEAPEAQEPPTAPQISLSDVESQKIEIASPAEMLEDAQAAQEKSEPPPIGKKEELVEVEKPPTFDFQSGEAELPSDASKMKEPEQFAAFPDLEIPQVQIPREPEQKPAQAQVEFKEPVLDEPVKPMDPEPVEAPKTPQPDTDMWRVSEPVEETTVPPTPIAPSDVKPESPPPEAKSSPDIRIPDDQMQEIVQRVSQAVIEKIAWEVVPDMAERIIKAEIKRLTEEEKK